MFTDEQRSKIADIVTQVGGAQRDPEDAVEAIEKELDETVEGEVFDILEILETVEKDGLPMPRDLDVALDAIQSTIFS